jgi:mRNA-degrading endonuclease RelE of RelBE toxin-antitoxin system
MYDIELTPEAREDLKSFRKFERKEIVNEIELQLSYKPAVETRNRKEMRPN